MEMPVLLICAGFISAEFYYYQKNIVNQEM